MSQACPSNNSFTTHSAEAIFHRRWKEKLAQVKFLTTGVVGLELFCLHGYLRSRARKDNKSVRRVQRLCEGLTPSLKPCMLVNQMLAPTISLKSLLLALGGGGHTHCRYPAELTSTPTPSPDHQRCFQTLLNAPPPGGRISVLHIMGYIDLAESEKSLKMERGKLVIFLKFWRLVFQYASFSAGVEGWCTLVGCRL